METLLTIPIQTDFLLDSNSNKSEFGHELKQWAAISMYYFGKISLARAATLADMQRSDFEHLLTQYKLPHSLLDRKDAEFEVNILKAL